MNEGINTKIEDDGFIIHIDIKAMVKKNRRRSLIFYLNLRFFPDLFNEIQYGFFKIMN